MANESKKVAKEVTEAVVDAATVAALLNLTIGRVRALTTQLHIKTAGRGRWKLIDVIMAYVAFIKEENKNRSKGAAESRVRDARAAEIELRMARADREVIALPEALSVVDDITGIYLQSMSSLPARITREQNERRRIEAICDEERLRVADHLAERASALRTGLPIAEADGEEDA